MPYLAQRDELSGLFQLDARDWRAAILQVLEKRWQRRSRHLKF
jgi:hypothetical protein